MFSQHYRFHYDYEFVTDTVDVKKNITVYYLDVLPNKIKFYNENLYKLDSIQTATNKHNSSISLSGNSIMLTRLLNSNINVLYKFIDQDYYKIESIDDLVWEISSDTKSYKSYKLQKATTTFGGRIWTAWFSREINLPVGPYKFCGLPGLIFEITDDKKYFSFKLTLVKNLNSKYSTTNFLETNFGKKAIPVTLQKYKELLLTSYNNPFSEIRSKMEMGEDIILAIYGRQVKNTRDLDEIKRIKQEEIRKNYNPIERNNKVIFK